MTGQDWDAAGFHGKLPTRGDFVTRRVPAATVAVLDDWLEEGIAFGREALGNAWPETFRDGPLWRFAFDAGVAGPRAMTGVMVPSRDRVGRAFPLLVAGPLDPAQGVLAAPLAMAGWLRRAREVALTGRDPDLPFDDFDAAVAALGVPAPDTQLAGSEVAEADGAGAEGAPLPRALAHALGEAAQHGGHGGRLSGPALPAPEAFASLMDGDWTRLTDSAMTVLPL